MTPSISVIIATYNRAELLPRAVDSVLAQTYTDWELLRDATPEAAKAYQQRDRRVRHAVAACCTVRQFRAASR